MQHLELMYRWRVWWVACLLARSLIGSLCFLHVVANTVLKAALGQTREELPNRLFPGPPSPHRKRQRHVPVEPPLEKARAREENSNSQKPDGNIQLIAAYATLNVSTKPVKLYCHLLEYI
jgi:hypothetical protein